jgi:xanthine dehydrogenase YagR molybdenum-binding subunit
MANSPFANAAFDDVAFRDGRLMRKDDPGGSLALTEILHAADLEEITEDGQATPRRGDRA